MMFILNKGNMKQVKLTTGMVINVPAGYSSAIGDSMLDKMVNSSSDLSYISKGAFLGHLNITPTKTKIELAKKNKQPLKPPEKKKKYEEKVAEKTKKSEQTNKAD